VKDSCLESGDPWVGTQTLEPVTKMIREGFNKINYRVDWFCRSWRTAGP
jgi:hypothetical protein